MWYNKIRIYIKWSCCKGLYIITNGGIMELLMKDEYNSGNGCRIYLSVVVKYFFLKKLYCLIFL